MNADPPLELAVERGVVYVTMNRPPVNAIDSAQLARIDDAIASIRAQDDARLVILRGAGKHFCAGADVGDMAAALRRRDLHSMNSFVRHIQVTLNEWAELPVPTIAVMQGAVCGGGLEFALACDLRIASHSARFSSPEVKLGLVPAAGGTQRLTKLVGSAAALRMMLSGEEISATDARSIGLLQWCVEDHKLSDFVSKFSEGVVNASGAAQRRVKELIRSADTPGGYLAEVAAQRALHGTPDTQRRLQEFIEGG